MWQFITTPQVHADWSLEFVGIGPFFFEKYKFYFIENYLKLK